jgi:hypothetical protein
VARAAQARKCPGVRHADRSYQQPATVTGRWPLVWSSLWTLIPSFRAPGVTMRRSSPAGDDAIAAGERIPRAKARRHTSRSPVTGIRRVNHPSRLCHGTRQLRSRLSFADFRRRHAPELITLGVDRLLDRRARESVRRRLSGLTTPVASQGAYFSGSCCPRDSPAKARSSGLARETNI